MDTPASLDRKAEAAYEKAAADKARKEQAALDAARIAEANRQAEAALRQAEKANRINRILIIVTAAVGLLNALLVFFSNMQDIIENLLSLL